MANHQYQGFVSSAFSLQNVQLQLSTSKLKYICFLLQVNSFAAFFIWQIIYVISRLTHYFVLNEQMLFLLMLYFAKRTSIFLLHQCLNPGVTMMPHTLMNLEKGIEIASCWKEFNPHIRKILSKKYPRGKTNGKIA